MASRPDLPTIRCECSDPGCPCSHSGRCHAPATERLIRPDLAGEPTIEMCERCAHDALGSGVFAYIDGEG